MQVEQGALTWASLCARFPDEWVALTGLVLVDDANFDFGPARVVAHAPRRADAVAMARSQGAHLAGYGCFYTGVVPALDGVATTP